MAVVVRGHVRDRPFARTVYAIAAKRFSGDLVLTENSRAYKVTWQQGAVVAAESAWPADSPGRIALTAGLVNATELAGILRAVQASPGADQLATLARMARLTAEQVEQIRRRALVQQAMRIFALADASFVLDSESTGAAGPARIDVRWLIYHGVRTHYSEERLASDLAAVRGASFRLARTSAEALALYGFDDAARACVRELASRAMTLDELAGGPSASRAQTLSKKDIAALIYALLATDAVSVEQQAAASQAPREQPVQPAVQPAMQAQQDEVPLEVRHHKARAVKVRAGKGDAARQRAVDPSRVARIRELIATKLGAIDAGANHYELLGVTRDTGLAAIRGAYFELAKHLHPDRLRAAGVIENPDASQRLFARINEAFAVLGHTAQRAAYDRSLREDASDAGNDDAESMAARLVAAEQHFLRGEMALRRNQFAQAQAEFEQAVALSPDEAEHHALLAWSQWCAAADKAAVRAQVEDGFKRAIALSRRNVAAHFYRGQVASIAGDLQVALSCFRTVLDIQPEHRDATLQVRLLEGRLGAQDDRRKGLLDRLKRR